MPGLKTVLLGCLCDIMRRVTREGCLMGERVTLCSPFETRQDFVFSICLLEGIKPTHCPLNWLQGQRVCARVLAVCFVCVICVDAVLISVVLSLHCADLFADAWAPSCVIDSKLLLRTHCLHPTILKCWMNFKFFFNELKE